MKASSDNGNKPATCNKHGYHRSFSNIEESKKRFEDPERLNWQKPLEVIESLKIAPGDRVADFGAGTGFFSLRIAKAYPDTIVYALDIEPAMIAYLKEQTVKQDLSNHKAIEIDPTNPRLPAKVNLALVVNTYHHLDDRVAYFHNLKKQLKTGARVAIIDFTAESPEGPPLEHRISIEQVKKEMNDAGYTLDENIQLLPFQYFLVFKSA